MLEAEGRASQEKMLLGLATLYSCRVLLRASLTVLLKEEKMNFGLRKPIQPEAKRGRFGEVLARTHFFIM